MRQIIARQIAHRQFAEHIVEDGRCVLDRLIALHHACRFEAREGEGLHIFFQWHAILQTQRNSDGEIVHHRTERCTFLVHVDEDFAQAPIIIFTRTQINLVATHECLLGIALATGGQLVALTLALNFHDPLHDALGNLLHAAHHRLGGESFHRIFLLTRLIRNELRGKGLGKLRAIAVKRIGLQRELPGKHISFQAFLNRGLIGHVDGLGNGTRDEGLGCGHHADMALGRQETLAEAAARIGAIKHRIMLMLQPRRAF